MNNLLYTAIVTAHPSERGKGSCACRWGLAIGFNRKICICIYNRFALEAVTHCSGIGRFVEIAEMYFWNLKSLCVSGPGGGFVSVRSASKKGL
jgi:hypothetical protein